MPILLEADPDSFATVAHNAAFRRERLPHRAIVWGGAAAEICPVLRTVAAGGDDPRMQIGTSLQEPSGPALIYSGNGSQWSGMGRRLLKEDLFRETVAEIDGLFSSPWPGSPWPMNWPGSNGEGRYQRTEISPSRPCLPCRSASPACSVETALCRGRWPAIASRRGRRGLGGGHP
jgi:hypothetical protein